MANSQAYNPSAGLLNLYDTQREKPFEFMHSRSFVNVNVATGWTAAAGGHYPWKRVIRLVIAEGDFPITVDYQPYVTIQPNGNPTCAPENFPYAETTGINEITLYAYQVPSSAAMLPVVVNLTQSGTPYGSTNAAAGRSSIEQVAIQLSKNYFFIDVDAAGLTLSDTALNLKVTAYKGGDQIEMSLPPFESRGHVLFKLNGVDPLMVVPENALSISNDKKEIFFNVVIPKNTLIENGMAIIQFPVTAGSVFYPRATVNTLLAQEASERIVDYQLKAGRLTISTGNEYFVNGVNGSDDNPWRILATQVNLKGVVSPVLNGAIRLTSSNQAGTVNGSGEYILSNGVCEFGDELDHTTHSVFRPGGFPVDKIKIELLVDNKVVESIYMPIRISEFSAYLEPTYKVINSNQQTQLEINAYTISAGGGLVPEAGTLRIYRNNTNGSALATIENATSITYNLKPEDFLNTTSFIVTLHDITNALRTQIAIPVNLSVQAEVKLTLVASPNIMSVSTTLDNVITFAPESEIKIYRGEVDVTNDFNFVVSHNGGAEFGCSLDTDNKILRVTKFNSPFNQITITITATNRSNSNITVTGYISAFRNKIDPAIADIIVEYCLTDTTIPPPTDDDGAGWVTQMPDWVANKYLWIRDRIVYKDSTDILRTTPVLDKSWTALGTSVSSVQTQYYISKSSSGLIGGEWTTAAPAADAYYVWERTVETLKNGTITYYPSEDGIYRSRPTLTIKANTSLVMRPDQEHNTILEAQLVNEGGYNTIDDLSSPETILWTRLSADTAADNAFKEDTNIRKDKKTLEIPPAYAADATYICIIGSFTPGVPLDVENESNLSLIADTFTPRYTSNSLNTSLDMTPVVDVITTKLENLRTSSVSNSDFIKESNRLKMFVAETQTTVGDLTTYVNGVATDTAMTIAEVKSLSSNLTITSREIDLRVQEVSNQNSTLTGQLNVQAGLISSKVSRDGVISSINQSPEEITISANKINLEGYATFKSLTTPGETVIDGSNIKTGIISSANGASTINMTDGTFSFGNGSLTYGANGLVISNYAPISYVDNVESKATSAINQTAELNTQVQTLNGYTQAQFNDIKKYIQFVGGNIELGDSTSQIKLVLENNIIKFEQNGSEVPVAYISNNKLYITNGEFLESLRIGNFEFTPRTNGNLSFGKVV